MNGIFRGSGDVTGNSVLDRSQYNNTSGGIFCGKDAAFDLPSPSSLQLHPVQLAVQRLTLDAQQLRGLGFVAASGG
jgi:hypothetical protein